MGPENNNMQVIHMKKFAIAAAAAAAVSATPVLAQEGSATSFYVGPVVGYESVKLSTEGYSESDDGVMYGVVAGADFALGTTAFIGLEGEYTESDVKESAQDVFDLGDEIGLKTGRSFYVGARAGVPVGGAKVYIKGGYVNARLEGFYDDGADIYVAKDDMDGWLLGAGVEAKLSPVVLRLEYRYSDLGDITVLGVNTDVSAKRHQVVAGALFSF